MNFLNISKTHETPLKMSDTYRLNNLLAVMFLMFTVYLYFTGYFKIELLSDDYLNILSANTSTLTDKFTGDVPYYSKLHFRPLWFMSIQFSTNLSGALGLASNDFTLYRIENLILFFLLTFAAANVLLKLTMQVLPSVVMSIMVLTFPNNLNSICWTIGKVDLMTGILIITSIFYAIKFAENNLRRNLIFSGAFLSLGLLTKETAIITPIVCYLLLKFSNRDYEKSIKKIFAFQSVLVISYLLFRIFLTPATVTAVTGTFSEPTLIGRLTVFTQAMISLIIPYDYLTLQRNIEGFDFLTIFYLTVIVILAISIIARMRMREALKFAAIVSVIFLVSVIPNLIAGYFRPQLILIPFILTSLAALQVLNKSGLRFKTPAVIMSVIILFWIFIGSQTISDWLFAGIKTEQTVNELLRLPEEKTVNSIFIGLPGRFRQAHLAEYATGPYNYFRFGLSPVAMDIKDAVHVSALDAESLNSELRVESTGKNEYNIYTTGETQYFQITGGREHNINIDDVTITLDNFNTFRKPTRMKITANGNSGRIYIYNKNQITELQN